MTMPNLWSVLHAPPIELLGWTLLHFVWQGVLVAAVLAGALYLLRNHSPRVRYVVGCAALLGLLALPMGTGMVLSERGPSADSPSSPSVSSVESRTEVPAMSPAPDVAPSPSAAVSWRAWAAGQVQPVLPWIVVAWGAGVLVFAVRLGGGAWRVRRLRRSSRAVPAEWQDRLRRLADQMDVGAPVALRQSDQVESPVLAGWWRPVILVPAGFLSGLPPKQVEALLLHELAHVRRHDVLVGRLQAVVETLLFFHPATWWVSRKVREAREACCDDLAVQAGTGRAVYAQALAALAEQIVGAPSKAWTPAAADGSLLKRIRRLVAPQDAPFTTGRRLSILAAALLMVAVPVGLAACASQKSTTDAEFPDAPVPAEPDTKEAAEVPAADDQQTVVVIRGDSTERTIRLGAEGPVEVDSLDENVHVFRHGDSVDTVDIPGLDGGKGAPHPPFPPDSLERDLRMQFDLDSLERVMEARFDPDSLERAVRMRFDRDHLEQHMRRLEHRADSLAQRFAERWRPRDFLDSTLVYRFDDFDPDHFRPEDFGPDLDVDSLVRGHQEPVDSLRRHFEQMRERREEQMPKRLREQARRLREQAERLEERAESMERSPEQDENGSPE